MWAALRPDTAKTVSGGKQVAESGRELTAGADDNNSRGHDDCTETTGRMQVQERGKMRERGVAGAGMWATAVVKYERWASRSGDCLGWRAALPTSYLGDSPVR